MDTGTGGTLSPVSSKSGATGGGGGADAAEQNGAPGGGTSGAASGPVVGVVGTGSGRKKVSSAATRSEMGSGLTSQGHGIALARRRRRGSFGENMRGEEGTGYRRAGGKRKEER